MADCSNIEINPARRLMFSPEWDDLSIVFDARSGDFWIVSKEVGKALRSSIADPAGNTQELPPDIRESMRAHGIIQ